ncbi:MULTISPECIES: MFS transporter [unclassified Nocardiopsis]|uniref:MFS transporter n=1 Tax=Nocardiopsis TaxID=2013 RepID=UPI00387A89D6
MTTDTTTRPAPGARATGLRIGALFGPAVFGVTAAGVALPEVAADLGVSPSLAVWVLTAHALALGIGTALFGRLSDGLGGRSVLVAGAALLAAGSVLCLVAGGLGALIAGRLLLASGSGAVAAVALGLTAAVRPDRRAAVLAVFGGALAACSACATLAGGAVTELLSWRVTVILPTLSLAAVPLCLRLVDRRGTGRPADLPGAALLAVAAAAALVLPQSPSLGLPMPATAAVAAAAVLAGGALALRVRRVPEGFVPRRLAADRAYLAAAAVGGCVYAGLFAAVYAVPQVLVVEHGWDVLAVGLWLLPGAAVGGVLSRLAGGLVGGRGARPVLGLTAAAFGTVLIAAGAVGEGPLGEGPLGETPVLPVAGASLGFAAFSIAQVVVTGMMARRLAPAERGGGLGLLNLAFFVGGGAGAAIAGAVAGIAGPSAALAVAGVLPLLGGVVAFRLR